MKVYNCDRCSKTLASPQSFWNHRQRCKDNATKDGLHETSGNSLIIESRIGSTLAHKEKFVADIKNNVSQRAKDQPSTSILPRKRVNSVGRKQKALIDFNSEKILESEPDSDSEDQSTTFYSDSEPEETEISEDDEFMPDNLEELKAAFRNLYKKVHNNIKNYNKLVLILDELHRVNCLTKEECNGIKMKVQKKIGIA